MRSLLFVPGDNPRKLEKGMGSGADALILDLEDSVAASAKPAARGIVADFLREARRAEARPRLIVRVNALDTGLTAADLAGIMPGAPDLIMLPKTVGGADVADLGNRLAVAEAEADLPDGGTGIVAIATENARGIFGLASLPGASRRLSGITWGAEDLSADLGAEGNRDERGAYGSPFRLARDLMLFAAASAEVDAIDSVYTAYRDLDGLAAECREARRDGFVAKMAIHPAQVPVINEAFTPSPEALAHARAIVAAFEADPGAGVVGIEGEMIDRPHLRRAERILRRIG